MKGKIDKCTVTVADFNTSVSAIVRTSGKMSKYIEEHRSTINYQVGIYATRQPTEVEHAFFSSIHRPYTKMDCILSRKTSLTKFERIEIALWPRWNQK